MSTATDERLGPLSILVGSWSGSGHGVYPTIESFDYIEEITFTDPLVKPFLAYTQRTRHATEGRPLHAEAGYLRWTGSAPELTIAEPSGITEAHRGAARDDDGALVLEFDTVAIASTPAAKRVDSVSRRIVVRSDELTYELFMGAVGEAHQLHLTATLARSG